MRRSFKLLLMLGVLAALGFAAWFFWFEPPGTQAQSGAQARAQQSGSKAGQAGTQPVPVLAAKAEAKDVPIILRGIGTAQAYNSVSVKSRVDGNIVKVGFTEGQFVHAGDLLFQLDPRPFQAALQQANANLAKDRANLENAQVDLARYTDLLRKGAGTQQQYATQRALVAQLQAQVAGDQSQIEAARLNLDYAAINSPIDGVTGMRLVDIGNLVSASAGTTLVVVTQIEPIYIVFSLPERDIDRVRRAMAQRKLTVLAFDGEDKHQISQGVLTLVNNTVDQNTGTVSLKAEFANKDEALWPGQFVNAHLVLETVHDGVTIPSAAVQTGPKGSFAYVVKPDSTVGIQAITIRQVENNTALIGSGLKAGEEVVTAGQFKLTPGTKVAVKEGSAPPEAETAQSEPAGRQAQP